MSKKRSYHSNSATSKLACCRGYPLLLASCERGLERKTAKELKELCIYHLDSASPDNDNDDDAPSAALSLDEELAMLRKEPTKSSSSSNFGLDAFDTGITGLVAVAFRSSERTERPKKQAKPSDDASPASVPPAPTPVAQQPFTIVNTVVDALVTACTTPFSAAPHSRYVQRVIPLMVSCYLDLEEIRSAASSVVASIEGVMKEEKCPKATFGIQFKSRLSNKTPKREEIISLVAKLFDGDKFSVNLGNPDFTVVVEILKNLVGIGFVRGYKEKKKLNLIELAVAKDDKDEKDDDDKPQQTSDKK